MAADIETVQAVAKERPSLKRLLPLLVLLALPLLAYATGLSRLLSFDLLAQYHGELRSWVGDHLVLSVLMFTLLYTLTTALSLPAGLPLTVSGGFLFGWIVGGSATVVGATTGATIVFLVARSSVGAGLVKQVGPWLEKLREGFGKDSFNYLLFLRLVPAFPFWIVNLVPAVLGMSLVPYVLATVIGIIPATYVFAYIGTGLESVVDAATQSYQACLVGKQALEAAAQCHLSVDPSKLVTPEMRYALLALAAISLLPIVIKRLAGKRATA